MSWYIHPEMTAGDVPEWDSMSHVRLMLTVERAFNTKFAAAEIAGSAECRRSCVGY